MKHREFSWKSADGLELYAQDWLPEDAPRAGVALVHGLGEHSGRYQHVAEGFVQAGFAVVAFDQRGHGKSEGPRGHAPSFDILMDDIQCLIDETTKRVNGAPIFLYGHSLGGTEVLYFALKRQAKLTGVIATSPGLASGTPVPGWKMTLAKIMANLMPAFSLDNGLPLDGLSHDPEIKKKYLADPLVHPKISARLGLDLMNSGLWIQEHGSGIQVPLLLMYGSGDPIVSPSANNHFASKLKNNSVVKVYPNGFHELHNEPYKAEVIQFMVDWITLRLQDQMSYK